MIQGMRSRQSEMPIPTRTAPRPPGNAINQRNIGWGNNDPFGSLTTLQPIQRKKIPPPRPPPPRFRKDNTQSLNEKSKKPTRPTDLLSNLFGIRTSKQPQINVAFSGNRAQTAQPTQSNNLLDGSVSLIDLSPPGSPTFTTRSSSDGVSVDSFGSDGNSNPSVFTSSGNTSQTESAFEDDFDFFGSLSKRNTNQNDPWKGNTFDPFSPISSTNQNVKSNNIKHGDATFYAYNGGSAQNYSQTSMNSTNMPTIIRARPPKPPAPKIYPTSLAPTVANFNATSAIKTSGNYHSSSVFSDFSSTWSSTPPSSGVFYERTNSSPPMPSIPAPAAPPAEYLTDRKVPRTKTLQHPHGVALYDFEASQPGDLSLKQGDIIILKKKVSDEWLEGQIGNRTGIFPANFIDITVPLPGVATNVVNALYKFSGETWEDLPFEEGAKLTVLSKISDDWLYGECDGKKGQFPTNYVDRVPHNLPKYS